MQFCLSRHCSLLILSVPPNDFQAPKNVAEMQRPPGYEVARSFTKDWKVESGDLWWTSQLKETLLTHPLLTKRQGRVFLLTTAKDGITDLCSKPVFPCWWWAVDLSVKTSRTIQLTQKLIVVSCTPLKKIPPFSILGEYTLFPSIILSLMYLN